MGAEKETKVHRGRKGMQRPADNGQNFSLISKIRTNQ